jgi:hypothetical protein
MPDRAPHRATITKFGGPALARLQDRFPANLGSDGNCLFCGLHGVGRQRLKGLMDAVAQQQQAPAGQGDMRQPHFDFGLGLAFASFPSNRALSSSLPNTLAMSSKLSIKTFRGSIGSSIAGLVVLPEAGRMSALGQDRPFRRALVDDRFAPIAAIQCRFSARKLTD